MALTDQWYLSYGDPEWMQTVMTHIKSENFNSYNDKIGGKFEFVLGWLKEWACSRQFGLGNPDSCCFNPDSSFFNPDFFLFNPDL